MRKQCFWVSESTEWLGVEIFCLVDLSIGVSGVLKSPTLIVLLLISPFSIPLGLALGSPIFPSGCEGKLGVALEHLHTHTHTLFVLTDNEGPRVHR